jgi:hypothetical protein
MLTITRNPFGFKNKIKKDVGYQGVTNEKRDDKTGATIIDTEFTADAEFERKIISILRKNDIEILPIGIKVRNKKALPDSLDLFNGLYLDSVTLELKNVDSLKRRIIGLSSYFRSAQEELLPRYDKQNNLHILSIPMSDYQFKLYEEERKLERVIEAKQKSTKKAAPVARAGAA